MRTLKATEDATAEPATQNIYMLCDMAMAMAPAIVERHSPGNVVTGKFRCTLLLPKPFFRSIMTGAHSCSIWYSVFLWVSSCALKLLGR